MNEFVLLSIVTPIILANMVVAVVRRRAADFQSYSAESNQHGGGVIALTLLGTVAGGGMFLAVGQIGYEGGIAGYLLGAVYLIGFGILALLSGRMRHVMEQEGHSTLIGLIGAVYGERVLRLFSMVCGMMYLFLLAGQFVAMFHFASFLHHRGLAWWAPWSLVSLSGAMLLFYPVVGGLRKDIQSDIVQVTVKSVAASILVIFLLLSQDLSLARLGETVSISSHQYGPIFLIGAAVFVPLSFLVRMDIWQRVRSARTPVDCNWGFWLAGVGSCLFFFAFTTLGIWVRRGQLGVAETASLTAAYELINYPAALAFVIGGFFAAVLSSADTLLNNVSLFIAGAVLPHCWNDETDKDATGRLLVLSRLAALLTILVAAGLGAIVPNFVDLIVGAFSLLVMFIPAILGLFIPVCRNPRSAYWSTLISTSLFVLLFSVWNPKLAFVPAVLLAFLVYGITLCKSKTS